MKRFLELLLALALTLSLTAVPAAAEGWAPLDYSQDAFWVAKPDAPAHAADCFFILPTVNMKETEPGNEDITDERKASRFVKTYGMEKGIAEESADVYAPFYRQATLPCYLAEDGTILNDIPAIGGTSEYFENAYADIRAAWFYYMENCNGGRPVVIFGYSQGAQMALRLLAEFGAQEPLSGLLVAAYAVGGSVDDAFLQANPSLKMAQGEEDTGVIISYNAMDARASLPDEKEYAINPLNWKTDATPAANAENLGYVATDVTGQITEEIPAYCGAYLDAGSGKLIVTGIENADALYEAPNGAFSPGDYHIYDLTFFYRNLQKNIADRIDCFIANR